jgi:hypothetical protein
MLITAVTTALSNQNRPKGVLPVVGFNLFIGALNDACTWPSSVLVMEPQCRVLHFLGTISQTVKYTFASTAGIPRRGTGTVPVTVSY